MGVRANPFPELRDWASKLSRWTINFPRTEAGRKVDPPVASQSLLLRQGGFREGLGRLLVASDFLFQID